MMFKYILLTFPIQSFVVTNIIKGMTLFNFFLILLILKKMIFFNKKFIKFILIFLTAYFGYFLVSQYAILLYDTTLIKEFAFDSNVILISTELSEKFYFRKSFFTQSLYLIIVVSFFFFLLQKLNEIGRYKILHYIKLYKKRIYG